MDFEKLKLFVHLVYKRGNLIELINQGVRYGQLTTLIEMALDHKYIVVKDSEYSITPEGLEFIALSRSVKRQKPLLKLDEMKTKKKGLYHIYLPKQETVSKLMNVTSTNNVSCGKDESSF